MRDVANGAAAPPGQPRKKDRRREEQARTNKAAMEAGVRRWISEAQAHPKGAHHLENQADWVERQLQTLSKSAELNMNPPAHLEGLTAFDLAGALLELRGAVATLRKQGPTP